MKSIVSRMKGVGLTAVLAVSSNAVWAQPAPAPAPPAPPRPDIVRLLNAESRSFLGVGVAEVDAERARALKLKDEYGVEVTRVEEDSPAEKAGLKTGDVVLEYNGQRVEGAEQFVRMVRETPVGRSVKLLINRAGTTQTLAPVLAARKIRTPEAFRVEWPSSFEINVPDIPQAKMSWRSSVLGVEAEALEGQFAGYFGVKEGVLVRSVYKNTAAEKAGLRAGDVLVKVDDQKVASPREVTTAVRTARSKEKKQVAVVVMREKKETALTVAFEDEPSDKSAPRTRAIGTRQQL